ncbi:MAG: DUF72 domain-containing protein [Calditrichaeota bacterium]|jgi:uncharacterized protein YecE (DUF72 family)|nr:DUF72 domain-containing protein [Calditrichota bacterium]MBT7790036.1 DUF72 domain-containing protein [Calditrichota bacterium]
MTRAEFEQTSSLFPEEFPEPIKRNGHIHIGTSGYVFQDWRGEFYPKGLSQQKWLDYYANHFEVVEINATYYRLLPESSFETMLRKTPATFTFWVKVPSEVTHGKGDAKKALNLFFESIQPLRSEGRLRGILAQFPPSFKYNEQKLMYLRWLKEMTHEIALGIEFRSDSWSKDETYNTLMELDLVSVVPDLPNLSGLPKVDIRVTAETGYIRFHGHNEHTWYNSRLGDRYDYNYSEDELKSWVPAILEMDEQAAHTYLFFNNCHAGQAVKNAKMMHRILSREFDLF